MSGQLALLVETAPLVDGLVPEQLVPLPEMERLALRLATAPMMIGGSVLEL